MANVAHSTPLPQDEQDRLDDIMLDEFLTLARACEEVDFEPAPEGEFVAEMNDLTRRERRITATVLRAWVDRQIHDELLRGTLAVP